VTFVAGRGAGHCPADRQRRADDVIVLAGKGHEDYQEINGERHAFSDLVEADHALTAWEAPMLKPMKLSELTSSECSPGRCRRQLRRRQHRQPRDQAGPTVRRPDRPAFRWSRLPERCRRQRRGGGPGRARSRRQHLPQLLVADTRVALGQLGALNRAGVHKPVAAITGSSGKTTVKEMLAGILRTRGPVLATRGNLNNDLGAPLTLLELARNTRPP
jgi:UDP-N-acetylmuramyl pentapeptide synthase